MTTGRHPTWKVFVVGNHDIARKHLGALIQAQPDLELCGAAPAAPTAVSMISCCRPDLVILDISFKRPEALHFLKELKGLHPQLRTLVLSIDNHKSIVRQAQQAGAETFLSIQKALVALLPEIRATPRRTAELSPRL